MKNILLIISFCVVTGCSDQAENLVSHDGGPDVLEAPSVQFIYGVPEGQQAAPPVQGRYEGIDPAAIQSASQEAAAVYFAARTALAESPDTLATVRRLMRKMKPRDWNVRSASFPPYVVEQIVAQTVIQNAADALPPADIGMAVDVLLRNRYPQSSVVEGALARLSGTWDEARLRAGRRQAADAYEASQARDAACAECQQMAAAMAKDAPAASEQMLRFEAGEQAAYQRLRRAAAE